MKIVWRTVKMVLLIGVMFIIQVKLADSQSLSICKNAKAGSPCRLTCTTQDVSQAILFFKLPPPGSQQGGCTGGGGTCLASNVRYTVTQNSTLSETYMDISNLTYAEDDSQWVCEDGAARSSAVQLTVISVPATVKFEPEPTADVSKTLVGEVYCVYPASSPTVKLVYQDGQTNNTLAMTYPVPTVAGTSGCGSHEFTVIPSYQLTPTTLSGKSVRFWIEVTVAGQVIGSALTTETFVFQATTTTTTPASSKICDSCKKTIALAVSGLFVAVVCVALCLKMYSKFRESGGGKGKFKCSVTWCFRATIIATVVSVIGFILCIAGLIICVTCDDSVSSSNSVTVGFALAVVGFVLAAVTLVIVIILVILFCRGVITKKDDGQTIKHVSVKNNDPLTLTCPAGDLATTLTWTGPGGIPYVTGTTVEADLDGSVKRRISASHKKRGYALMFTEVWSSDMGIYTSTVDETVVKHEVIVEGNPEHTETNQVNPKNVTDDEKFVKKGETTDGQKATVVEMKGIDKNDKVDNV